MIRKFTLLVLFFYITTPIFPVERPDSSPYVYPTDQLNDGIYLSFDEFIQNNPSISAASFKVKEADTNSYHLTIASFKINNKEVKKYKNYWGICLNGIPYINYKGKKRDRTFGINSHSVVGKPNTMDPVIFYRLDILGKVCVFNLEHVQKLGMPRSYSDFTVPKPVQTVRIKALDTKTGKIVDLTPGYVWDTIKDDAFLLEIFNSGYAGINLVQFIELYNERNPLFPVAENRD